jgi:tetratricopeptide (TPR) repeat protein
MTAEELHTKGREAGQRSNYEEAIAFFEKAHNADSEWPYPIYDLAFTYLLLQDWEKSLRYYNQCNQMAPNGFYSAKTALWTLEKEQRGQFSKGLYLFYVQLEWMEESDRIEKLRNILAKYPDYTPAIKSLQSLIKDPESRLELIERGLSLESDDETYGMLIVNKALLMTFYDKMSEAKQLLQNLLQSERKTLMSNKIAESILEQWSPI